jgi:hypothetical protein
MAAIAPFPGIMYPLDPNQEEPTAEDPEQEQEEGKNPNKEQDSEKEQNEEEANN